jgi:hypothetical protein
MGLGASEFLTMGRSEGPRDAREGRDQEGREQALASRPIGSVDLGGVRHERRLGGHGHGHGRGRLAVSLSLAQVDVGCDVRAAEDLFGVERIMRATPDTQVRRLAGAPKRS